MSVFGSETEEMQARIKEAQNMYAMKSNKLHDALVALLHDVVREQNILVQGFCHAYLARDYYLHNDMELFTKHLYLGIPLQEQMEDYDDLAISYNLLGIEAMNAGNYQVALDNYLHCIGTNSTITRITAAAYVNIGHIYNDIGELDKAIEFCNKGRLIFKECEPSFSYILSTQQESIYRARRGDLEGARLLVEELEALGHHEEYSAIVNATSDIEEARVVYYDAIGDKEKRDEAVEHFIEKMGNMSEMLDLTEDVCMIGEMLLKEGETKHIPKLLELLDEPVNNSNINFIKLLYLQLKVDYAKAIGNPQEMISAMQEYYQVSMDKKEEDAKIYRMNVELRNSVEEMRKKQKHIEDENRRLLHEASTDPLTGLANRALYAQKADELFYAAKEQGTTFGAEMIDVDYFKEFNDTYGHQKGDDCLRAVANVLKSVQDDNTFVARYGGDEFIILYSNLTDEQVMDKATAIKERLAQLQIPHEQSKVSDYVTVSQGVRNSVPTSGN